MPELNDIHSLDEYLLAHGADLARLAVGSLNPLVDPDRDELPDMSGFLRAPRLAQPKAIAGVVAALEAHKRAFLWGDTGTGKTLMGLCAVHLHAKGKPYRCLISCPDHLVDKWEREVATTFREGHLFVVNKWSDVLSLDEKFGWSKCNAYVILGRDMAKWMPNRRVIGSGCRLLKCPKCGQYDRMSDGTLAQRDTTRGFPNCRAEHVETKGGKPYTVKCGEPLWQWTRQPPRWSPARIIHKKLRGFFDYLIIDELHEHKSEDSEQALASAKLIASCKHVVAMTGTMTGGTATDLLPFLFRMRPSTVKASGFDWGQKTAWAEKYGNVSRVVTTTIEAPRPWKPGKPQEKPKEQRIERKSVKPGVMPSLFIDHLLGSSVFVGLDEVAEGLPAFFEYPGGPFRSSNDRTWDFIYSQRYHDGAVSLDTPTAFEYERLERTMREANNRLLREGNTRFMSAMLHTLLAYPDHPYDWSDVGYTDELGYRIEVVSPRSLDGSIRPKEQKLLDICANLDEQKWVYVQMTGVRDVQERLRFLLEREGHRVAVLRQDTVVPRQREAWLRQNGSKYDIIISHPRLVGTGLDFFDSEHTYNYNNIIFYQTGYNAYQVLQAAGRAWRFGQTKNCRVYYLYYKDTMQHKAMKLMAMKVAARAALHGDLSASTLASLLGADADHMSMARLLTEAVEDADIGGLWARGRKRKGTPTSLLGA
jgi:hypothetical protein